MKTLILLGLLLSCSKPIELPSDELIITSETCFVKYTIYRIIEDTIDSLRFQLSGILDCNYSSVARHRLLEGKYLLVAVSGGISKRIYLQKRKQNLMVVLN